MIDVEEYHLHMLSFRNRKGDTFHCAFGDGGNLKSWHLDIVETWLREQCAAIADDGSDLV